MQTDSGWPQSEKDKLESGVRILESRTEDIREWVVSTLAVSNKNVNCYVTVKSGLKNFKDIGNSRII